MARQPWPAKREERCKSGWIPSKKLIEAAQFIAAAIKGKEADDGKSAADDAAALGIVLDEQPEPEAAPVYAVLPENMLVLSWFMKLETQWIPGSNGPVGLNYGTFIQCAKDEGVKRADRVWILDDLRLMERAFLIAIRDE